MSSVANDPERGGDRQLPVNSSNTAEIVEGLELVPVPPESTWLEDDTVNEYVQLFGVGYTIHTDVECGLPSILKEHGDPLDTAYSICDSDDEQDHTCWLDREFCGAKGKHGRRRTRLVDALNEAISALKDGLLPMYRYSTIWQEDEDDAKRAGPLTPGLHRLATMRFNSLANGIDRLQEYHKGIVDTTSKHSGPTSSAGDNDTDDQSADDDGSGEESHDSGSSNGNDDDLAELKRRLLACKPDLLAPLVRVSDTKASIIKAAQDLKLAARNYDDTLIGPRTTVRRYYQKCILELADATSRLEHYSSHWACGGLYSDLKDIDKTYREARDNMYRDFDSDDWEYEMDDGLAKTMWFIWDATRSEFESTLDFCFWDDSLARPDDLEWGSDHDAPYSEPGESSL